MLSIEIDEENGIVILTPEGKLLKDDFVSAARVIDPYIDEAGHLNGIVIYTRTFPGWNSFAALVSHLQFVKDHHKRVSRIAFATESAVATIAEAVASHFVNAEIKRFSYEELELAKVWILEGVEATDS